MKRLLRSWLRNRMLLKKLSEFVMSTHGNTSRDELPTSAVLRLYPGRSKGEAVHRTVDIAKCQLTLRILHQAREA